MKLNNKTFFSKSTEAKIRLTNEHNVFRKIYFKYLLMRIRAKIGFIAFEKRVTILELFVQTISYSYVHLIIAGVVPQPSDEEN